MKKMEKLLFPLSCSELAHKQRSDDQSRYYKHLSVITHYENKPVYLFTFESFRKKNYSQAVKLSNQLSNEITLLLVQHTRYSTVPLHMHDYIEINYVMHGHAIEWIEGKQYVLKKGDICFIDTHTIHTLLNTTKDDIIINILVKKAYFSSYFLNQLPKHGQLSSFIMQCISVEDNNAGFLIIRKVNSIRQIILQILNEEFKLKFGAENVMESLLLILFIFLTRETDYYYSRNEDFTRNIYTYIQANFRTTTLKQAAQHFSFQPNYFSTLVKQKTGETFKHIVQRKQMETAANYLKNTDWPINRIIIEVGCSNASFFYQKFKKIYGTSPRQYRENNNITNNIE